MDIFALTETELFKKLRQGLLNEDLHVDAKEFMLCVHEVTNPESPTRAFALDALIIADIELQKIKEAKLFDEANRALAQTVEAAHKYVLFKIEAHKNNLIQFKPVKKADSVSSVTLGWRGDKTEFMELCYDLKIGEMVGDETSQADVIRVLAGVFGVDVTPDYCKKRFYELKVRSERKSKVALLDKMAKRVLANLKETKPFESFDEDAEKSA